MRPFHFTLLPPAKWFLAFVIVCFVFAAWPTHTFKIGRAILLSWEKRIWFFSYCEIDLKEGREQLHFQTPDNSLLSALLKCFRETYYLL